MFITSHMDDFQLLTSMSFTHNCVTFEITILLFYKKKKKNTLVSKCFNQYRLLFEYFAHLFMSNNYGIIRLIH